MGKSTRISAVSSQLRMSLDKRKHVETTAHMMLITNMPFLGLHFQISSKVSVKDGWLEVFTFSDMSKLNMISNAMLSQLGSTENTGIQQYGVKHAQLHSIPRMPVLADGLLLGESPMSVHVHPGALAVMTGAVLTGSQAGQKSRD